MDENSRYGVGAIIKEETAYNDIKLIEKMWI